MASGYRLAAAAGCLAAAAGTFGKLGQSAWAGEPGASWLQPVAVAWFATHVAANAAMTLCFVRALQRLPSLQATVTSVSVNVSLTVCDSDQ